MAHWASCVVLPNKGVHVAYTKIVDSVSMYQSGGGHKVRSNCTTAPEAVLGLKCIVGVRNVF